MQHVAKSDLFAKSVYSPAKEHNGKTKIFHCSALAQQPSFCFIFSRNYKYQRKYNFCPGTWQMGKQSVGFFGSVNKEMKCGTPRLNKSASSDPNRLPCLIPSAYWFARGKIGIPHPARWLFWANKTVWQDLGKWGLSCNCNEMSGRLHCIGEQKCSISILLSNYKFWCDVLDHSNTAFSEGIHVILAVLLKLLA